MFGVGGESLNMAVNTYTVAWFRDTDLNMVFGLQLSVSRLELETKVHLLWINFSLALV